ncbi:TPA: hypothetical protein I2T61_02445 [Staphylococcus aureus]|nr:hypothetical protein [Staphylococcus aureus]HAR7170826.1 hypothetical protein [Staphylococcus aureus]HAR7202287.1 hypothetical protein [Staphylococcus aureus]
MLVRGPNTEADEKSGYNNVQVGGAPTQKLTKSQVTIMCKLAGPQQREIGTPNSTDNVSWGGTTK